MDTTANIRSNWWNTFTKSARENAVYFCKEIVSKTTSAVKTTFENAIAIKNRTFWMQEYPLTVKLAKTRELWERYQQEKKRTSPEARTYYERAEQVLSSDLIPHLRVVASDRVNASCDIALVSDTITIRVRKDLLIQHRDAAMGLFLHELGHFTDFMTGYIRNEQYSPSKILEGIRAQEIQADQFALDNMKPSEFRGLYAFFHETERVGIERIYRESEEAYGKNTPLSMLMIAKRLRSFHEGRGDLHHPPLKQRYGAIHNRLRELDIPLITEDTEKMMNDMYQHLKAKD